MKGHLSEALIDELAEARDEVEGDADLLEHLATCALCRREVELARVVMAGLDSVPRLEAPAALLQGVMARVERKSLAFDRRGFIFGVLTIFVALIVSMLWLFSGGAATLVLEALETIRSLETFTRITTSVWRTIPLELFTLCAVVLVASSAVLSRLMRRARRGSSAAVEAS
jgi:hypothetical protein